MNRSKQAGMGMKAIVVLLVGFALASVHLAEAQQQAKLAKIGWLDSVPHLIPLVSRHFAREFGELRLC